MLSKKSNPIKQKLEQIDQILLATKSEDSLNGELLKAVQLYARDNLNWVNIGTSNYYTVESEVEKLTFMDARRPSQPLKRSAHPDRATAVNHFFTMMKTSSTQAIYEFVTGSYFQQLLSVKSPSSGKDLPIIIKKFIDKYKPIAELKNASRLRNLLESISPKDAKEIIGVEKLIELFCYCDSRVVADVIVNVYGMQDLKCASIRDIEIKKLLDNDLPIIREINFWKSKHHLPLISLPHLRPIGENLLIDKNLNDTFQYDDSTVAAFQAMLIKEFPHLLVNSGASELAQDVSNYFCLIPSHPYRLINPDAISHPLYSRYQKLKEDLQSLLLNKNNLEYQGKPIIFIAMFCDDQNRYIPCIIYRCRDDLYHHRLGGVLKVVTVVPYAEVELNTKSDYSKKMLIVGGLRRIFQDIFKYGHGYGYEYKDLNLCLMSSELHYGPAAATVLKTILSTFQDKDTSPFIRTTDNGLDLSFNVDRLKHYRSELLDYYTNEYLYSAELELTTLNNRQDWYKVFSQISEVPSLQRDESKPLSMSNMYTLSDRKTAYSYDELARKQKWENGCEYSFSVLKALMVQYEEQEGEIERSLVREFKETGKIPGNPKVLIQLVQLHYKDPDSRQSLLASFHGDLHALVQAFIKDLLKDHVKEVLTYQFEQQVLKNLHYTIKDVTKETEVIVNEFFDAQITLIVQLSIFQQNELREVLLISTKDHFKQLGLDFHYSIFKDWFVRNCRNLLTDKQYNISPDMTLQNVIRTLYHLENPVDRDRRFDPSALKRAFAYLKEHDPQGLEKNLETWIGETIDTVFNATLLCIPDLDKQVAKTKKIGEYVDEQFQFVPWDLDDIFRQIKMFAEDEGFGWPLHVLLQEESDSYLANKVLERLNKALLELIHEKLKAEMQPRMLSFFSENNLLFLSEIKNWKSKKLLDCFDLHFQFKPESIESEIIRYFEDYGHADTFKVEDFKNLFLQELLKKLFLNQFEVHAKNLLERRFKLLANEMLEKNQDYWRKASTSDASVEEISLHLLNSYKDHFLFYTCRSRAFLPENGGNTFFLWFQEKYIRPLMDKHKKRDALKVHVHNSILILNDFLEKYKHAKQYKKISILMSSCKEKLGSLYDAIKDPTSSELFHEMCEAYKGYIASLIEIVFKLGYREGEVYPGHFTSLMRPYLFALLGIKDPLYIVTSAQAKLLDHKIRMNHASMLESADLEVPKEVSLLSLDNTSKLSIEGFKLTRSILIHYIAFWRSKSFKVGEDFINALIHIVNETHDEDISIDNKKNIERLVNDLLRQFPDIRNENNPFSQMVMTLELSVSQTESSLSFSQLCAILKIKKASVPEHKIEKMISEERKRVSDERRGVKKRAKAIVKNGLPEGAPLLIKDPTIKKDIQAAKIENGIEALWQKEKNESIIRREVTQALGLIDSKTYASFSPNTVAIQLKGEESLWGFSLFGSGNRPVHLEKILDRIKTRHDNQEDFVLNASDLKSLEACLAERWQMLQKEENPESHYLTRHDPLDERYIRLADVLTNEYKKQGVVKFNYALLMPNHPRFPAELKEIHWPVTIAAQHRQDTSVNNIPLSRLLITGSYAFDIDWFIYTYNRQGELKNFYTNQELEIGELEDICKHPKAKELLELVAKFNFSKVTERGIRMLRDFVNQVYNPVKSSQVININYDGSLIEKQLSEFKRNLACALPHWEANLLLQERIPCVHPALTVEQVLKSELITSFDYNDFFKHLARVVLHYLDEKSELKRELNFLATKDGTKLGKGSFEQKGQVNRDPSRVGSRAEKFLCEMYLSNNALSPGSRSAKNENGWRVMVSK